MGVVDVEDWRDRAAVCVKLSGLDGAAPGEAASGIWHTPLQGTPG